MLHIYTLHSQCMSLYTYSQQQYVKYSMLNDDNTRLNMKLHNDGL